MKITAALLLFLFLPNPLVGAEMEIKDLTRTKIVVREHPRTGKPYVSITSEDRLGPRYVFQKDKRDYLQPDYRMLDPKVRAKDVPYDGPVSDRKKVYILAASLAASGVAAGVLLPVAPVTGTGAGAGAAGFGVAGGAVASGTISTAFLKSNPEKPDDFEQKGETKIQRL